MRLMNIPVILGAVALVALASSALSCEGIGVKRPPGHDPLHKVVGGPPAHAPAVGLRSKVAYTYYPDMEIYFDPARKVWFWQEGLDWKTGVTLPTAYIVAGALSVAIDLETDKPYEFHAKVKGDHPGKGKGGNKRGGKNK